MHKHLISFLVAGALMPAAASAEPGDRGVRAHDKRSEKSDNSAPDRQQHFRRAARSNGDTPRVHVEQSWQSNSSDDSAPRSHSHDSSSSSGGHRDYHQDARQDHREFHASDPGRSEHRSYHRKAERDHRTEHRSWDRDGKGSSHGDYHDDLRQEHNDLHATDPSRSDHREWHRDANRQHDRRHQAWDTNWRRNSSYDWYGYRNRYRSLFRLGSYYDPYGWNYRRFPIGYSLWPSYYGSNYWLNDPWQYRLPPAYGPYRWVRYYDDALLVNIYTGQVVDVVYNFFW